MKLSFLFLLSLAAVVCSAGTASAPVKPSALPALSSIDRDDIVSTLLIQSYHYREYSGLFRSNFAVLNAQADAYQAAATFVQNYKASVVTNSAAKR